MAAQCANDRVNDKHYTDSNVRHCTPASLANTVQKQTHSAKQQCLGSLSAQAQPEKMQHLLLAPRCAWCILQALHSPKSPNAQKKSSTVPDAQLYTAPMKWFPGPGAVKVQKKCRHTHIHTAVYHTDYARCTVKAHCCTALYTILRLTVQHVDAPM